MTSSGAVIVFDSFLRLCDYCLRVQRRITQAREGVLAAFLYDRGVRNGSKTRNFVGSMGRHCLGIDEDVIACSVFHLCIEVEVCLSHPRAFLSARAEADPAAVPAEARERAGPRQLPAGVHRRAGAAHAGQPVSPFIRFLIAVSSRLPTNYVLPFIM